MKNYRLLLFLFVIFFLGCKDSTSSSEKKETIPSTSDNIDRKNTNVTVDYWKKKQLSPWYS